jgi:signal transduction histidine kinase
MFSLDEIAQRDRSDGLARYWRAFAAEWHDEAGLDSLGRAIGADVVEHFAELRTEAVHWHEQIAPLVATGSAGVAAVPPASLRQASHAGAALVLGAAERLEAVIQQISEAQHRRVREMERLDVLLPLALTPFALASALVVFWMGRRMLTLAHEAEVDRRELARAMEAKAGLMRGVTHDLKNPLVAAMGYTELLADGVVGALTPEQHDIVGRVSRLITVSFETVNDLLELAKVEARHLSVDAIPTNIGELVHEVVTDYQASARAACLTLDVVAIDAPLIVETDPARVRQVLSNLLSNAIKYTPSGGRVTVRIACEQQVAPVDNSAPRDGEWVALAVEDTGPGIPAAYRERIFEEFFQLSTTQARASGTGVGLAISRRVAHLLDGELTVGDAPAGGSVFTLWLPLRRAATMTMS